MSPVAHSGTLAWTRSGRCIAVDNRLSCITRLIVRRPTPSRSRPSLSVFAKPSPTLEARGQPASAVAVAGYSSCWRSARTEPPSMARWFRCDRQRGCTAVTSRSCPETRRVEAHGQHLARLLCPVKSMATRSGTFARIRLRAAVRRQSWRKRVGTPAAWQAVRHAVRQRRIVIPSRWKTSGLVGSRRARRRFSASACRW